MYVETIMSRPVDTVTADLKLSQVAHLMREKGRRFLPVVDAAGGLVGLLSHREVERAAPSAITTLSVGEVNYLMAKVTVGQVMRREVITCGPRALVEAAGQLMRAKGIGCLPVIDEQRRLLGIVTDDDILDFFLAITGCGLDDTTRIAVHLPDRTGELSRFLGAINAQGGYIATVVSPVAPDATGMRVVIARYRAADPQAVDRHLRELGIDIFTEEMARVPVAAPPAVPDMPPVAPLSEIQPAMPATDAVSSSSSGPAPAPAATTPADPQVEAARIGAWMAREDRLARLLGMELTAVSPGACAVRLVVRDDLLNAVGLTHGGATYALADFAFAVASNSHGEVAVALSTQMSYPAASRVGDTLIATATEQSCGARTGLYSIEVRTQTGKLVGLFTGTVFRRGEPLTAWLPA
ncbi:MAG: CBS domain-containing protein [Gammaproteobacteria bacterium]|jgi:acetoin utilization protein AcuB|nr:CBS domain-containing protein [Gammaproteobacteria bacterium]